MELKEVSFACLIINTYTERESLGIYSRNSFVSKLFDGSCFLWQQLKFFGTDLKGCHRDQMLTHEQVSAVELSGIPPCHDQRYRTSDTQTDTLSSVQCLL